MGFLYVFADEFYCFSFYVFADEFYSLSFIFPNDGGSPKSIVSSSPEFQSCEEYADPDPHFARSVIGELNVSVLHSPRSEVPILSVPLGGDAAGGSPPVAKLASPAPVALAWSSSVSDTPAIGVHFQPVPLALLEDLSTRAPVRIHLHALGESTCS